MAQRIPIAAATAAAVAMIVFVLRSHGRRRVGDVVAQLSTYYSTSTLTELINESVYNVHVVGPQTWIMRATS